MPSARAPALEPFAARRPHPFADWLFLCLAALYALAALQGIVPISGGGADMDSDLSTYAFAMAGPRHPENFRHDAILREATPANSFWNLEQFLGEKLTPGDQYAVGLFRAGALAIFVFYAGAYLLGRWLFGSPALACMLAVFMGITFWMGWGTFWGIAHSDPIPRVFFAALWSFLLLGAVISLDKPFWRPLVMLATGLCMWVHGISALNAGAMFFLAFALHRPAGWSWGRHLAGLGLCLILYFIPVLIFLWPSLTQKSAFSAADLEVFQRLFDLRWREDYGSLGQRLAELAHWSNPALILFCGGLAAWLVVRRRGGERARRLAGMYPAFVLALALVVLFSWAESQLAPAWGRLPMAHEFVRGLRFLVPLSWLMIVAAVAVAWPYFRGAWGRVARGLLLAGTVLPVLLLSQDRQHMAALYAVSQRTGICLPLPWPLKDKAERAMQHARAHREALDNLRRLTRPGEVVFSNAGDMGVRHLALRGLSHTFKDGSHPFYNKRVEQARTWLEYEFLMRSGPTGYVDAWLASGVPWLLSDRPGDRALIARYGDVLWENKGWLIARRR